MQNNEQYWERRALIRLTDAEKTSLIYEKKIRKAYRKAERDIEQEIEKIYSSYAKDVGLSKSQLKMLLNAKETSDIWKKLKAKGYDSYIKNNYKARISRLEAIKAQLYEKSKDVGKVEQKNLKQALRKVFKDSYSKTNYDICKETNIDAFSSLDNKTVDTVINSKWHGDNYSTRVWNNTEVLAAKLDDVMTRSVMSGASMSKAMREIRETFNTHNYYAERLIRTETNRAHNEAEALAYDNMGVKEYVFVATLDNRTSLMCQEHDQKRYKLSERKLGVNYPPLHPNCRSTVRAFIDEETERLMQRRARNPFTGETEIVGNISYKEWIDKHKGVRISQQSNSIRAEKEKWFDSKFIDKKQLYYDNTTSSIGKIVRDSGLTERKVREELKVSRIIYEQLGGNIRILNKDLYQGSSPDYVWNDKLWELKTPEGPKNIHKLIEKAIKQISSNVLNYPPGGIIIDLSKVDVNLEEAINIIKRRIAMKSSVDIDFIIIKDTDILTIEGYEK